MAATPAIIKKRAGSFCPDDSPRVLSQERLFDIAASMAVDDPDFPDMNRFFKELDDHWLEYHVLKIHGDQLLCRDIPDQFGIGIFPGVFRV